MTSDEPVFVWAWRPGHTEPVIAGRLDAGPRITFTYGRSYLDGSDPFALGPDLPLVRGRQMPPGTQSVHGTISDAMPDSWGQRVILHAHLQANTAGEDPDQLPMFTYLLGSGSNRTGALDFQRSPSSYEPREAPSATLTDLQNAADRVMAGQPLPPSLDRALLHASSIGGARPKVRVTADDGRQLIAKFSHPGDLYPVVKAEAAAMHLARLAGADAAPIDVVRVAGRDVLLVERFDRRPDGARRQVVSLLTLLELDAFREGRYASYHEFADQIRARFTDPRPTLQELFRRIVINIATSNTDDHARNHAAFWDGRLLTLTPAYDICPQQRSGEYTEQAIAIGRDGSKAANYATCIDAADVFLLDRDEAISIVEQVDAAIRAGWPEACEFAHLTKAEADWMWGHLILNPGVRHS